MLKHNRVVVTGIGAVTPIGNNVNEFCEAIKKGVNGIDKITNFDTSEYKVKVAGEIKNLNIDDYIDKKSAKRMDRYTQLAMIAADEAIKDCGIDFLNCDTTKYGIYVASGIGGLDTLCNEMIKLHEKGVRNVSPLLVPMMISNIAAGNISIKYNLKGSSMAHVSACASSTHAIGEAFRAIKYGHQELVVSGGAESAMNRLSFAGFQNMTALSTNENPNEASRPFDIDRDGFVMGEGAGILVLENYDSAIKRGAKIYAEVVGYGSTSDAYHITSPAPTGDGAGRAMIEAMQEAGVAAKDVDYINAHGTSTPLNEKFETLAVKMAFGEEAKSVLVNSTKSMTGHMLGGTGAVEAIATILQIQGGFCHGTINLKNQDPECDLNVVKETKAANINIALSNSLGFGGHNAALVIKKFEK